MKKILSVLAAAGVMFFASSCSSDDKSNEIIAPSNEVKSGIITSDEVWTADRIWEIQGRVIVGSGATLTIEAGTIVKGHEGEGTNASVLMVARGGKLNAVGTAPKPIIFTSVLDNIALGSLQGTNLSALDQGLWGGLVILGNAPISPEAGTTNQIEGVPASESLGQYGGTNASDNSGIISYISIRHGGTTIDPAKGNDINGLTLGGVGSRTTISYVEILANVDDGVEFFGGSVNVSNILVVNQGDDAIDIDQAYSGTIDNFMVIAGSDSDADEGLEIDGPEGPENATGKFTLKNGTIISTDGGGSAAEFKSKAQGTVTNVKWSGFTGGGKIKFRASFDGACADKTDAYKNLMSDNLTLSDVEFGGGVNVFDGDDSDACTVPAEYNANAATKVATSSATGASNPNAWSGWTFAAAAGLLN